MYTKREPKCYGRDHNKCGMMNEINIDRSDFVVKLRFPEKFRAWIGFHFQYWTGKIVCESI